MTPHYVETHIFCSDHVIEVGFALKRCSFVMMIISAMLLTPQVNVEQYCLEANYNQDRNMDENQSPMSEGSGDKSRTKMVDILCTF